MTFAIYPTVADEVARYLEDGTLNEALGAGPTLAVSAGTERWTDIVPGVLGFACDEATELNSSVYYAPLSVTGAVTVECLFRAFELTTSSDQWTLVSHEASGETEAANVNFSLKIFQNFTGTDSAPVSSFGWRHEYGAGQDAILVAADRVLEPGGIYHLVARRGAASGGVQLVELFLNGEPVASSSLTALSGGTSTSARIAIGRNISDEAASAVSGAIGFVRVCSRALTDEEIEAAYDATLGGVFGARLAPE